MEFLDFIFSIYRALPGAISQGVLWGLMTLGVYLSFRLLNMADMTVDGSFAAGGAITAILLTKGFNPYMTLIFVFGMGLFCGLMTGFMTTKLRINILLAGILSQIALYSINIRIMGKANTPLLGIPTMMSCFTSGITKLIAKCKGIPVSSVIDGKVQLTPEFENLSWSVSEVLTTTTSSLIIGVIVISIIVALMYWFFGTEYGSAIRATGSNENMVRALGVNTDTTKIIGLMISNGLIALSGALVAQSQGYGDVMMGQGAIVIGLASIIIGEVVFGIRFGLWYTLISVVLGSVIYRIVIAVALSIPGFKSTDLKVITAVIVALSLSVPVFKSQLARKRTGYKGPENEKDTRHDADKFKHGSQEQ